MAYWLFCFFLPCTGIIANNHDIESTEVRFRISEGQQTDIEKWPWLVQVEVYDLEWNDWIQTCAGIVLTDLHILSAAHCFSGRNYYTSHRRIRAGTSFRELEGIVIDVEREHIHPGYHLNIIPSDNNIAVVVLAKPLTFSSRIQPTALANNNIVIPVDAEVRTAGWGVTYNNTKMPSKVLMEVTFYAIKREVCLLRNPLVDSLKNVICALTHVGHKGVCMGDSGGGLYFGNRLVGITYFGSACDTLFSPGVFTYVPVYYDWIVSKIT